MTLPEFAKALLFHGLEAVGKYYSSYRGYVMENDDPENMGRILVTVPAVTSDKQHTKWAWPKSQFSGSGYGIQLLPVKGDIVWVEFENGNARFPLWSHGHFGKDEKPTEFASAQVYGFKSPKGQMVIIDDRDGQEKVIVKSMKHLILESDTMIFETKNLFLKGLIVGTPRFSVGANGTFASVDGRVVEVTNGLITGIK